MTDQTFEEYHKSCLPLILKNDFEGLLKKAEEDLAKDPENPVYWTMKGYALHELGRKEEALEAFNHSLELDSSSFYAHSDISLVLGDLGRWEEVIKHCDEMLRIEPKSHANFLKGIAFFEMGKDKEARECLRIENQMWEDWLRENPDAPKELLINAYNWMINILHTLEEYEKELNYFDKMWELLPKPMPSHAVEYREKLEQLLEKKGSEEYSD